jgi:hypothetical protein
VAATAEFRLVGSAYSKPNATERKMGDLPWQTVGKFRKPVHVGVSAAVDWYVVSDIDRFLLLANRE